MKLRQKTIKKKNQSGKCPCEICNFVTFLQTHHINGRNVPNPNHKDNIVSICPTCHNEIHFGKIIVEGWFVTSMGRELIWRKDEEKITNVESTPHIFKKNPHI